MNFWGQLIWLFSCLEAYDFLVYNADWHQTERNRVCVHDMSTSLTIISISLQRPKWASFCLCFFFFNEEWWSGKENKQQEDDEKKARERERRRERHRTSLALSLVTEGLTTSLAAYCFLPTDDPSIHTHTHTAANLSHSCRTCWCFTTKQFLPVQNNRRQKGREREQMRQRKLEEKEILKRKHSFTRRSTFFIFHHHFYDRRFT